MIATELFELGSRFVRAAERIAGALEALAVQDRARFAREEQESPQPSRIPEGGQG